MEAIAVELWYIIGGGYAFLLMIIAALRHEVSRLENEAQELRNALNSVHMTLVRR